MDLLTDFITDSMQIGSRIKQCRKEKRETLEDIGNLLGVNKTTVMRWERGENTVSKTIVEALAQHFGVNPDWLIGKNVPRQLGCVYPPPVPKKVIYNEEIKAIYKDPDFNPKPIILPKPSGGIIKVVGEKAQKIIQLLELTMPELFKDNDD